MANLAQLLKEGRKKDAWLKYCGFIDLSLKEFMQVQQRLLQEQLELLKESILGKQLLGKDCPGSLDDFRQSVPLTTYQDYHAFFSERREEVLPVKPSYWVCTSGLLNDYERKWAPFSRAMAQVHIKNFLAAIIFSVCTKKGEFVLKDNFKFLYAMAPPPYLTGMVPYGLKDEFSFDYLPPLHVAEKMTFEERNREGFRQGLIRDIDLFFGVSSVLQRIGEKFALGEKVATSSKFQHPAAVYRLAKGLLKSKARKGRLLPKDIWNLKGIVCAGTDTSFYKERIEHLWGRKPLEVYGGTEIGIAATQTWDYEGMTLFPDANFWEFIPEDEHSKSKKDSTQHPSTVLLDELEPGKRYEVVITSLRGGAFVRYRVGDVIKVLGLRNENLGFDLPQIVYEDRIDDIIDLAGFTRITERTFWQALKSAGVTHGNWVASKAFAGPHPVIQLYLEVISGEQPQDTEKLEEKIHLALRMVDSDYHDLEEIMGYRPLKLTVVPEGSFKSLRVHKNGEEVNWVLGPGQRINPPENIVLELVKRMTA